MKQKNNNYCLCAILQEVFSMHKINLSQNYIAKKLTRTEKGFKIDDFKIKEFLKKKNFDYNFYWWNETPFNEPDTLLKEIHENNGFIGIENHVYFVLEFKDPMITIMDPADEMPKEWNYYSVMDRLRKYNGGFGLIKCID